MQSLSLEEEEKKIQKPKIKISSKGKMEPFEFLDQLEPYGTVWIISQEDRVYIGHKKTYTSVSPEEYFSVGERMDEKWLRYGGYNLKTTWKRLGLCRPLAEWDSMIAEHLLTSESSKSFRDLCRIYLKTSVNKESPIEDLLHLHVSLREKLEKKLQQHKLEKIFQEIEKPVHFYSLPYGATRFFTGCF